MGYLMVQKANNLVGISYRYESSTPWLPRLPLPHSSPQLPHRHHDDDRRDVLSKRQSYTHLDSHRYFSPPLPQSADTDDTTLLFKQQGDLKSVTQENTPSPRRPNDVTTQHLRLSSLLDWNTLWIVFLLLDAMLLLCRMTRTYANALSLCHAQTDGSSCRYADVTSHERRTKDYELNSCGPARAQNAASKHRLLHEQQQQQQQQYIPLGVQRVNCHTSSCYPHRNGDCQQHPAAKRTPTTAGTTAQTPSGHNSSSSNCCASSSSNQNNVLTSAVCNTLLKVILSKAIPQVLVSCVVLFVCYVIVTLTGDVITVESVASVNLLGIYFSGLRVQANQTNWYLQKQADHFNDVSVKIFESQMTSELQYLETMSQYFDSGETFWLYM